MHGRPFQAENGCLPTTKRLFSPKGAPFPKTDFPAKTRIVPTLKPVFHAHQRDRTLLTRFLADQGPGRAAKQKEFDRRIVSISTLVGERERTFDPSHVETPDQVFMKSWAAAVLDNSLARLKAWCDDLGRPDWFEVFQAIHFPQHKGKRVSQTEVAKRMNLTRDRVRYGLEETDQQFVSLLREEVASQVDSPSDVEDEINEINRLLSN